jgi:hypothetical protein
MTCQRQRPVSLFAASFVIFLLLALNLPARAAPLFSPDIGIKGGQGNASLTYQGAVKAAVTNPLDEWWWRNPLPTGNSYYSVTYGKNGFLAMGTGPVLTSPDGTTWNETVPLPVRGMVMEYPGVAYGNGAFVAVGSDCEGSNSICTSLISVSRDGATWSRAAVQVTDMFLKAVAYGNNRFVAVGFVEPGRPVILTSSDGVTWASGHGSASGSSLWGVTYGNGAFVAVGMGNMVLTSPDGVTWTERNWSARSGCLMGVAYGNGTFVALGDGPILTSPDGVTWTERTTQVDNTGRFTTITWGNGAFLAGSNNGTLLRSTDGIAWSTLTYPELGMIIETVTYGNGTFVAFTMAGGIVTSPDGVTWTERASTAIKGGLKAITYNNGMFIAVGIIYTHYETCTTASSPDGATWTETPLFPSLRCGLYGVAYGNGTFVAVGYNYSGYGSNSGAQMAAFTSPDGTAWTERRLPVPATALLSVVYGSGTFVAVGSNTTVTILTSGDGVIWTSQAVPGAARKLKAVTYGNGTFVAVGGDGNTLTSDGSIVTSPDGRTWTPQTTLVKPLYLNAVAYGNGTFVAVGYYNGSSAAILSSSDGITWTKRASPVRTSLLEGVTYGNGTFVAMGHFDAFPTILTSPDGITWTRRVSPASGTAIAYGNKTFVAVGGGGKIIQSSPLGNALSVAKAGGGQGKITSKPSGIDCGAMCEAAFTENQVVTLTATPGAGSAFAGWSGSCAGSGACAVAMSEDAAVAATFVASPALSVSPGSLNFGKVKKGGSAAKIVTIKNTGVTGSSLTINAPAITGSGAAQFAADSSCGAPLSKGGSCAISVAFTPQSYDTSASAVLAISSDATAKGTASVKLTGASGPPKISASPLSVAFPTVSANPAPVPSRTVTVKNTGVSALTVSSVSPRDGTDASFGVSSDCSTLQQNETCKVAITFNPSTAGRKTGWIDIASNASSAPTGVKLSGNGK